MATAANIIERAMRLIHQLPAGGTPTSSEYADGLIALNAMVDSWRNESLMCYAMREESLTLSSGVSSYSIGPSGTLNTTRPVAIENAYILDNGISYPVALITPDQYEAIETKTLQADWPEVAWYQPTMPTGTLFVNPVPNSTRTMKLLTRTPLTSFSATSDTVSLPPGWERALAANLALELAPEFETRPSAEVTNMAMSAKAGIRQANSRPIVGLNEIAVAFRADSFNIYSD
jgi:hypothetical protein